MNFKFFSKLIPVFLVLGLAATPVMAVPIRNVQMLERPGDFEVSTQSVTYHDNVQGFLAKPTQQGNYPAVIMIHEFWGLNDNIKTMAEQLAREGYTVLAVDLYNGQVAGDQTRARELVSQVNQEQATRNLASAVNYVRTQESAAKVASIGWCFGGGQSLQLAISGQDLDATVIYYGQLTSDKNALQNIQWPVLGIFGDQDQVISTQSVNQFQTALNELGIENEIYMYEGVGHAFANPSGMNYAPEQTKDAWDKTLRFLNAHLKEN